MDEVREDRTIAKLAELRAKYSTGPSDPAGLKMLLDQLVTENKRPALTSEPDSNSIGA